MKKVYITPSVREMGCDIQNHILQSSSSIPVSKNIEIPAGASLVKTDGFSWD